MDEAERKKIASAPILSSPLRSVSGQKLPPQ
jgi:hypothetical protein